MAADNDIADVQAIDREFGHRREVPVVGCDDVADIAVGVIDRHYGATDDRRNGASLKR
jgi:hypothetical protein